MNDTDHRSCWNLVPSFNLHNENSCPNLTRFVKETVPCPPPKNLCLFWKAANNTKLSDFDLKLVTTACDIPQNEECSDTPVFPSTTDEGCQHQCISIGSIVAGSIVPVFLIIILCFVIYRYLIWRRQQKGKWPELCKGVCICCDKVLIQKKGLNRTESRSPTLADSEDKGEKDNNSNAYENDEIILEPKSLIVEYKLDGNEEKEEEYGIISNSNEYVDVYKAPPPDVVTMVSDNVDANQRMSQC